MPEPNPTELSFVFVGRFCVSGQKADRAWHAADPSPQAQRHQSSYRSYLRSTALDPQKTLVRLCSKPLIILVGRSEKVIFPNPAGVVLPPETSSKRTRAIRRCVLGPSDDCVAFVVESTREDFIAVSFQDLCTSSRKSGETVYVVHRMREKHADWPAGTRQSRQTISGRCDPNEVDSQAPADGRAVESHTLDAVMIL